MSPPVMDRPFLLIDSHCHLDFPDLAPHLPEVLSRAASAGVFGMVSISTRLRDFPALLERAEAHRGVWCTVGTHPLHVDEESEIRASTLMASSSSPSVIGIGESGFDYGERSPPKDLQRVLFLEHISAARQTGLPLIVHSRHAEEDTADLLEHEYAKGPFSFVLHCFSSRPELAERGLALGGYVSFSGIVTFKNAEDIREVARTVPLERLLIETDAPYLAPVPKRGKVNEPAFVRHTAESLANLRGISLEAFARQTTTNFFRLFSKAEPHDLALP